MCMKNKKSSFHLLMEIDKTSFIIESNDEKEMTLQNSKVTAHHISWSMSRQIKRIECSQFSACQFFTESRFDHRKILRKINPTFCAHVFIQKIISTIENEIIYCIIFKQTIARTCPQIFARIIHIMIAGVLAFFISAKSITVVA